MAAVTAMVIMGTTTDRSRFSRRRKCRWTGAWGILLRCDNGFHNKPLPTPTNHGLTHTGDAGMIHPELLREQGILIVTPEGPL
jgi:hypothetical protein